MHRLLAVARVVYQTFWLFVCTAFRILREFNTFEYFLVFNAFFVEIFGSFSIVLQLCN